MVDLSVFCDYQKKNSKIHKKKNLTKRENQNLKIISILSALLLKNKNKIGPLDSFFYLAEWNE